MEKLLKDNRLPAINKEINFNYDNYMDACILISEDIKKNYEIDNIEIIALARGGLVMLTTISHLINKREVGMIQTQMSNSDNCHDYGQFRYLNDNLTNKKSQCILLEDIIYKGTTTKGVIELLKEKNKEVVGIYSLVIDEDFKNIELSKRKDLKYVYEIAKDNWVYFFWEKDLRCKND